MKETNKEKEKLWNNGADKFQPNGDSKQAIYLEVSPKTTDNDRRNISEVKAW
jgi:hypothetical protein